MSSRNQMEPNGSGRARGGQRGQRPLTPSLERGRDRSEVTAVVTAGSRGKSVGNLTGHAVPESRCRMASGDPQPGPQAPCG